MAMKRQRKTCHCIVAVLICLVVVKVPNCCRTVPLFPPRTPAVLEALVCIEPPAPSSLAADARAHSPADEAPADTRAVVDVESLDAGAARSREVVRMPGG